ISDQVTMEEIRNLRVDPGRYAERLWGEITKLEWIGLTVPVEKGGSGGSIMDIAVLFHEIGRGLLPIPYLSQWLAVSLTEKYGNQSLQDTYLAEMLRGSFIVSLAISETDPMIRQLP